MIIELQTDEIRLSLLTIGATIYKIETKDKDGKFDNIILSHENIETYFEGNPAYFGSTCGRVAGRIVDAKFEIDNVIHSLSKNYVDKHTHHGGEKGLSNVEWDFEIIESGNKKNCIFTYNSPDLENGFPGNVEVKCEYVLENNKLTINYYGTSDRKTFLNLTNHSYFNLSKNEELYNHKMFINSNNVVLVDKDVLPLEIVNVTGSEFDFSVEKDFGCLKNISKESLLYNQNGIDNAFIINKGKIKHDLILSHEETGRSVKVKSTYPTIVLYSYNFPIKEGLLNRDNKRHVGLAIEPQYAPNAMNDKRFNIPIVDKNAPYQESIVYEFN